jgi:hypothetical protein
MMAIGEKKASPMEATANGTSVIMSPVIGRQEALVTARAKTKGHGLRRSHRHYPNTASVSENLMMHGTDRMLA